MNGRWSFRTQSSRNATSGRNPPPGRPHKHYVKSSTSRLSYISAINERNRSYPSLKRNSITARFDHAARLFPQDSRYSPFFLHYLDSGEYRACAGDRAAKRQAGGRSEEHTSELQSHSDLVCRLLLEKKKKKKQHERGVEAASARVDVTARRGAN